MANDNAANPEVAVSTTTGTTNNSVPTGTNEEILTSINASTGTAQFVQVPAEVYASYMRDIREAQVAKKVKVMANEYTSRRNTLIIRKVNKLYPDSDFVKDEEVVAYYDLYKMRETIIGESKKIVITDAEIEAYIELWTGAETPSLEAVENLIAKKSI